jgi:hypothetical protein
MLPAVDHSRHLIGRRDPEAVQRVQSFLRELRLVGIGTRVSQRRGDQRRSGLAVAEDEVEPRRPCSRARHEDGGEPFS